MLSKETRATKKTRISKESKLIKEVIKFRKDNNITQYDLAQTSKMNQQSISRIENLNNSPTLRHFMRYVNALGLEIKIIKK